jgi:hypothetical protein
MKQDPIVEEVRRVRAAYAAQFDFDLRALVEDLKVRQAESTRVVVSRKPRKPTDQNSTAA